MSFTNYLDESHTKETVDSYRRVVEHFLFHSENKSTSTYLDIINYLDAFNYRTPRVISALKKYFDYLIEIGTRETHPCKTIVIPRKKQPIQFQELFSKEELETLLQRKERYQELINRNKLIISLLIYQALTPQNIVNLRTKDIDTEEGTVYIKATKTCSRRTLELKPKQIILVMKYLEERNHASQNLFIGKLGEPIKVDTLNRILRPLKKKFPRRNLNAQTIRQSVITNWLNADNIAVDDVQLLSGQRYMSSVQRYVKPNNEYDVEMINRYFPI